MSDKPIHNDEQIIKELQQRIESLKQKEVVEKLARSQMAKPEAGPVAIQPAERGDQAEFKGLMGEKPYDADAQARNILERSEIAEQKNLQDVSFVDGANRPITIRTWESGNLAQTRAYDTSKTQLPEHVSSGFEVGGAGRANMTLEHLNNGQTRVRLHDIEVKPEYRRAGIGGRMLNQIEQFARKHNSSEIYGAIENQDAHNYWANRADRGWTITPKGIYGEVHYKL